jgi:signal transduction histidine kinase
MISAMFPLAAAADSRCATEVPRRAWVIAATTGGIAACTLAAGAPFWTHQHIFWSGLIITVAVGASFIGSGAVAWWRRPANRTGPLLVLVGYLWFVPTLSYVPNNVPWTISQVWATLYQPVLGYVALAYPTGRLLTRWDRRVIALAVGWNLINNPVQLFFGDFDECSCGRRNLLLIRNEPSLEHALGIASSVISVPIIFLVAAFIVRRWWMSTKTARWVMGPALWGVAGAAIALAGREVADIVNLTGTADEVMYDVTGVGLIVFPVTLLMGVLRTRLSYSGVARLVRELAGPLEPGDVRQALSNTLKDPNLELYYWSATAGGYVDVDGVPGGPDAKSDRLVRVIEWDARPLAAIVTDPVLTDDANFVDAVIGAARLALQNEALQAEVRAQLAQLRGAAVRIVEAGETERRRIERNLHDGAQQRLLALSLSLASTRQRMGESDDEGVRDVLTRAGEQLQEAITELRELARGIHPILLTQEGLGPSLQGLAERASVPVDLRCVMERFPEAVEATAYFVAAEALTNAMRHARTAQVWVDIDRRDGQLIVSVRDAGVGTADISRGGGLRGLADRVAAIGGSLSIESRPGVGTTVIARLPCE